MLLVPIQVVVTEVTAPDLATDPVGFVDFIAAGIELAVCYYLELSQIL